MKLELRPDGYEKIDAGIQAVEDLASDGVFNSQDAQSRFQRIVWELKKLRQIAREVIIINTAEAGEPEAA